MDTNVNLSEGLEEFTKKEIMYYSLIIGSAIGIFFGSLIGFKGIVLCTLAYFAYKWFKDKGKNE